MKTGEGKTLVATLGLSQCSRRQGRPRRHGQRLSRPPRCGLDGPDLSLSRHVGRGDRSQPQRPGTARRLRFRHHLRDQQRIRLRLPARQYEILARANGPAAVQFRDRRRSGLDPDRRGADPSHHLGPDRRQVGPVHFGRPAGEDAHRVRLRKGRSKDCRPHRGRHREGGADARGSPADRGATSTTSPTPRSSTT